MGGFEPYYCLSNVLTITSVERVRGEDVLSIIPQLESARSSVAIILHLTGYFTRLLSFSHTHTHTHTHTHSVM